jgi:hypothetical protein
MTAFHRLFRSAAGSRIHARMSVGVCLAGLLFVAPACNVVGPAIFLVEGPPKIPAAYTLPKETSVVVFIDDASKPPLSRSMRIAIARAAQDELLSSGAASRVIDAAAAFDASGAETASKRMDLQSIGRAVGADLVIHATIDSFTLSPDGNEFLPTSTFRAKVVDTRRDEDARLWPTEPGGFAAIAKPLQRPKEMPKSRGENDRARTDLAKLTGQTVAKLFYDSERWQSVGGR